MAYQDLTEQKPFWNNKVEELKEGDVIEGKVVLIQEARDVKSSRTATLEKADNTQVNVWLSTVIDGAFRSGVKEGDKVRITYKGRAEAKNGGKFNDYKVEVERADA